jgi:menaquinone-9 beta-reductase
MPDSLEALANLGFTNLDQHLSQTKSHLLRGIRFIGDQTSLGRCDITEAAFPQAPGRGIRRTVLHKLLVDRANSLGVRFHWENSVQNIVQRSEGAVVQTNHQSLLARYVVGADGLHSRIAAATGLTEATVHSRRIGLRQHYTIAPWTDFVEVYWGSFGQAYVTPNSSNEVCVAYIANKKFANPAAALSHFPALQRRLATAELSGPSRGSITLGRKLRRVTSGRIALIGDASGSVDAITGEGLALCFRQASALGLALKTNDLAHYERAHRRILRLPRLMSRIILLMDPSPVLRSNVLQLFQSYPRLFSCLLDIHIGYSPIYPFALRGPFLNPRS